LRQDGPQGGGVQRQQDIALGADALRRFKAPLFRDERLWFLRDQGIKVRPVLAANRQHVGKALGGDEGGTRPAPFQQGVGGDGAAVDHFAGFGNVVQVDACQDGGRGVLGCGELFVNVKTAVLVQPYKIGKGAAGVNA
jgi:hypothetical protein